MSLPFLSVRVWVSILRFLFIKRSNSLYFSPLVSMTTLSGFFASLKFKKMHSLLSAYKEFCDLYN